MAKGLLVRAAEPHHRQERFGVRLGFGHELQRLGHDGVRAVAGGLDGLTVVAEGPVRVEEVGSREPLIKAEPPGVQRVGRRDQLARAADAVEVPFAEVARGVADGLEGLGDGHLPRAQRLAVDVAAVAVGVPPGQHAAAGRRAHRLGRVKTVQTQPLGRHVVKDGSLDVLAKAPGLVVVADVAPALVVGHA